MIRPREHSPLWEAIPRRLRLPYESFRYYRHHLGRWTALLRCLYWEALRGYDSELCEVCGRPYILWHAPTNLYVALVGSAGGLFCPACFDRKAEDHGVYLRWVPGVAGHLARRTEGETPLADGYKQARGAIVPKPGSEKPEVIIRRLREGQRGVGGEK